MRSLRRRLTWILLGLILFSWIGSAVVTVFYSGRVLLAQVDRQLEQYAGLVSYISDLFERQLDAGLPLPEPWLGEHLRAQHSEPVVMDGAGGIENEVAPALNVWLDGRLIAIFEDSPQFPLPDAPGFSFRRLDEDGSHWRLHSRFDPEIGLWIVVGIDMDQARWSMLGTLGRVLLPLLLILPLTLAIIYFGVQRGLRPLRLLTEQIGRRSPQALESVQVKAVPVEVKPVITALNALLERLATALESEQRFTANAAHELTTPLAAIKAEVQLCQRLLDDAKARGMLERIAARVDRAHHTVDQLLTLARFDPARPQVAERVDLERLLREAVAETAHLAPERELGIDTGAVGPGWVVGSREALAILLRNLLTNALRYATRGSDVVVELATAAGSGEVVLCISNDCEPLSDDEFEQLAQRFFRAPGSPGSGAGLGLSIVERVAELHGAQLSTGAGDHGRGFVARVRFPPVPSA